MEAPIGYSIITAFLLGLPTFLAYRAQFGGFDGSYTPTELNEALQTENNILVVDIRPAIELAEEGVLDLRRKARGKAASMPVKDVRPCKL